MKSKNKIALLTILLAAAVFTACAPAGPSDETVTVSLSETTVSSQETTSAEATEAVSSETAASEQPAAQSASIAGVTVYGIENPDSAEIGSGLTVQKAFEALQRANTENEDYYASQGAEYAYMYEGVENVDAMKCYIFSFGTDTDEKYTAEYRFCVNESEKITLYDAASDSYLLFREAPLKVNDILSVFVRIGNGGIDLVDSRTDAVLAQGLPVGIEEDYLNVNAELASSYDYDRDGNNELFIPFIYAQNTVGTYFRYIPEKNSFEPYEELNVNTDGYYLYECPDDSSKLSSFISDSATDYYESTYEWTNGKLVLIQTKEQTFEEADGLIHIRIYSVDPDRFKNLVSEESFDPNNAPQ